MTRCNVIARRAGKPIKNLIVDDAASEADAVEKFHTVITLPKAGDVKVAVDWMGAPPPSTPVRPAAKTPPIETVPAEVDSPAAPVAPTPLAGDPVNVLIGHGVTANDITDLQQAGLQTVDAVVAHAKEHGGLTAIIGIGPKSNERIMDACKSWRGDRK